MASSARSITRVWAAVAVGLAAAVLNVGLAAPAGASSIPFTDPNATGTIGFCDKSGHEVTSGKIGDAPFAWTAVSSAPAPVGYKAPNGRATLFVYQPIRYVDPGDWSGKQMTASSQYTSSAHPMAQATAVDPALVDFVSVFPPHWNGLVQLRMFFSAPDQLQHTETYPAAVVKVQGTDWTLVSGGHPACGAGKSVSIETVSLPSSVVNPSNARATPGVAASSGGSSTGSGSASASGSNPGGPSAGGAASNAAATSKSHDSGGSAAWWWLLALVPLAAAGGAVGWRVRRRAR
jgi:hypothetical protein